MRTAWIIAFLLLPSLAGAARAEELCGGERSNSSLATDYPLPVCSPALSALLNDVGIL